MNNSSMAEAYRTISGNDSGVWWELIMKGVYLCGK